MDTAAAGPAVSATTPIPIENIYYLFCYAWDRMEEAQSIPLGGSSSPDLPNLLARVLLHGTRALLRRGLDRNDQPYTDEIATVRGHIELSQTLLLQARNVRRLTCQFDELSHDLLHNQILKASMRRLARAPLIDPNLAHELHLVSRRMGNVSDIWLERSAFARVQLHRNNAYYDLLLKVAELAFDCLLPDPTGAGFRFHDVLRDERKMARVFEDFVRNFYKAEQRDFAVLPLTISWDAVPISTTGAGRLPSMRVDVFLKAPTRSIIIDTKYYTDALQSYHGSESFHSGNLYQLFAYLKNAAANDPSLAGAEGVLLYPAVNKRLDERFLVQGHELKVATIDLAQSWKGIEGDLHSLIRPSAPASIHA